MFQVTGDSTTVSEVAGALLRTRFELGLVMLQPGNGTQYPLALNRIQPDPGVHGFAGIPMDGTHLMVGWIGHGCWGFDLQDPPHWSYVAEKMGCGQADAFALAEMLWKISEKMGFVEKAAMV